MKVLIFTEGGGESGFGHITRSLSLYSAFREAGADAEILLAGNVAAAGLLSGVRHRVMDWRGPRGLAALSGEKIAVVDSYRAPLSFYRQAAQTARLLVSMDDYKRLPYPQGVVVNGAVAARQLKYPRVKGITYLLGGQYAPLRPEFRSCPRRAQRAKLEKVLITFGGGDTDGLAGKLGSFLRAATHLKIETPPEDRRLSAAAVKRNMLRADACVTACGQTTYELAACGVPQIGVGFASNQALNIKGWLAARAIKFAGWKGDEELFGKISQMLSGFGHHERTEFAARAKAVIDGRGAQSLDSTVNILTVISPAIMEAYGWWILFLLLAIIMILTFYILYQRNKFRTEKMRIKSETEEMKQKLSKIFAALREEVDELIELADKKPGLSESEQRIKEKLEESLDISEEFIGKEVDDIEKEIKLDAGRETGADPLGITRTWEDKYGGKKHRKK